MEQSKNIISFFGSFIKDSQMYPSHISLYVSLFQLWSISKFKNPFRICREDVMKLSKIKSFATYHKCINEIHSAGFIIYSPSYNPYVGSLVEIIDFERVATGRNTRSKNQKRLPDKTINFSAPTLYEVELYFNERGILPGEASQFYSFYQSKDWMLINNNRMKCWRSAARNWISKVKKKVKNEIYEEDRS